MMWLSEKYCDALNNPQNENIIQEKYTGLVRIYKLWNTGG